MGAFSDVMSSVGGPIGAVVGAISGAIGANQQRNFEREEAEKQRLWSEQQSAIQRTWNENMSDKQNAWNYEMWMKQNEYNTPAEQISRLRDAGLNPLYYGLDGSSAGSLSASQTLGYDAPSYQRASASSFENPLTAGLEGALKVAQISNIQANTAKTSEETLSEVVRRENMRQETENLKQDLKNKLANEKLTDSQRKQIEKGLEWADRLNEATLDAKKSESALSKSQKKRIDELLEGEKLLQSKTLGDFDMKWKKIKAEISKIAKENKILEKDFENYAINHANNGFMGTGLSVQNLIRMLLGGEPKEENLDSRKQTADATATVVENKY